MSFVFGDAYNALDNRRHLGISFGGRIALTLKNGNSGAVLDGLALLFQVGVRHDRKPAGAAGGLADEFIERRAGNLEP